MVNHLAQQYCREGVCLGDVGDRGLVVVCKNDGMTPRPETKQARRQPYADCEIDGECAVLEGSKLLPRKSPYGNDTFGRDKES